MPTITDCPFPWIRCLAGLLLFALLACNCAHVPRPTPSKHLGKSGDAGRCAALLARLDEAVAASGVRDAGSFRIQGSPYLRSNRFLASFRDEVNDPEAFEAWLDRLQKLDLQARKQEIENLPPSNRALFCQGPDCSALLDQILECGNILRQKDCRSAQGRDELRRQVRAPDEYIFLRRAGGLYPLTRLLLRRGVRDWQEDAGRSYSPTPPSKRPKARYGIQPGMQGSVSPAAVLHRTERDELGIPAVSPEARRQLFHFYAPVWEVETQSRNDRLGTPVWEEQNRIRIDTEQPAVFTHLSFTRYHDAVLTQLNYVVWFPARPKQGSLDLYGGFLDGLNYRVTLDADGDPLLYETVHNCGCYHKLFPTDRLMPRQVTGYAEPPLILQSPSIQHESQRMVVSLASRTHYVEHLYGARRKEPFQGRRYILKPYRQLLSLPQPGGGSRSLFLENSLVPGSERLERFLLWPSGVLSPGAMRQWGRHAVAFVGKRHFDDPRLVEHIFHRVGTHP